MRPEVDEPVLRLTLDLPEPLALDVVDARLHQLERHPRAPELMPDRRDVRLWRTRQKIAPEGSPQVRSDKSDKVRRDQIVAVEFFLDRTILLGEVDRPREWR
jgi:hypothetical protein